MSQTTVRGLQLLLLVMMTLTFSIVVADSGSLIAVETSEDGDGYTDVEDEADSADVTTATGKEKVELFVPTHDWKPVQKDQQVPAGLHIRLNLQTGTREAKLLDSDDKSGKDRKEIPQIDIKQFQTKVRAHRAKQRTREELKAALSELEASVSTEAELLRDAYEAYGATADLPHARRLQLLADIEYYVHQIDNAQNFAKFGGLETIITSLNDSSPAIREAAALVIGSAAQSNLPVQGRAVADGAMTHLVRLLATEPLPGVCRAVVYALSAITRHLPAAQLRFLQLGGVHALPIVFALADADALKVKVVAFIDDLLVEREDAKTNLDASEESQDRLKQYERVGLLDALLEIGWCNYLPPLLALSSHDAREKVAASLRTLRRWCGAALQSAMPALAALHAEYATLAADEKAQDGEEGYFSSVLTLLESLVSTGDQERSEL